MFNVKEYVRNQRAEERESAKAHGKFLERTDELYNSGVFSTYFAARQAAKQEFAAMGHDFK